MRCTHRKVVIQGPLEEGGRLGAARYFGEFNGNFESRTTGNVRYHPVFSKAPIEHIRDSVRVLATRAFGREVSDTEVDAFVSLTTDIGLDRGSLKRQGSFASGVSLA